MNSLAKFCKKCIWHLLPQRFEVNIMNVCLTFYFLSYQKLSLISNVCYWTEKENEIGPIWYFMSIPTWGGRKHESVYRYNKTFSIHVIMKNVVTGLIQHYWTRNGETFYCWHIYHLNKNILKIYELLYHNYMCSRTYDFTFYIKLLKY